jgi:hypothetical protein
MGFYYLNSSLSDLPVDAGRERAKPTVRDLMDVTPEQLEKTWEAFLSAFTSAELGRFLYFKLGRRLAEIVPGSTDFQDACFQLLCEAEKDGWLEELIRAAIAYKPRNEKLSVLALYLRIGTDSAMVASGSKSGDDPSPDTSDPLLVVEDFRKDLEKIPPDEFWNSEDYESQLTALRSWLPTLRTYARGLKPQPQANLVQSVLCELQLEDAIREALDVINAFEICLNCLLDSPQSQGVLGQTRYVQWFRAKSGDTSECLTRLKLLQAGPQKPRDEGGQSPGDIDLPLSSLIQRLQALEADEGSRLDERRQILVGDSGVGAGLDAVIEYLKGTAVPGVNNIRRIRELLTSVSVFIEDTASAQKRLPLTSGNTPVFPSGKTAALQKLCDRTIYRLDSYYRINRALIESWEEAALGGNPMRADAQDLYVAKSDFVKDLVAFRQRIAALA